MSDARFYLAMLNIVAVLAIVGMVLSAIGRIDGFFDSAIVFTVALAGITITVSVSAPAGHPSKERGRPD